MSFLCFQVTTESYRPFKFFSSTEAELLHGSMNDASGIGTDSDREQIANVHNVAYE